MMLYIIIKIKLLQDVVIETIQYYSFIQFKKKKKKKDIMLFEKYKITLLFIENIFKNIFI